MTGHSVSPPDILKAFWVHESGFVTNGSLNFELFMISEFFLLDEVLKIFVQITFSPI